MEDKLDAILRAIAKYRGTDSKTTNRDARDASVVFPSAFLRGLSAFARDEGLSFEEARVFYASELGSFFKTLLIEGREIGIADALDEAEAFFDGEWNDNARSLSALSKLTRRLYLPAHWYGGISWEELREWFPDDSDYIAELERSKLSPGVSQTIALTVDSMAERLNAPPANRRKSDSRVAINEGYKIVEVINQGGQKVVYEARQESSGQRIALKEPPLNFPYQIRNDKALIAEARLQAELSHQGVPVVYSLDPGDGGANPAKFIERLIPSDDWDAALAKDVGRDGTRRKHLEYLVKVSQILSYAHRERKVVHCDVKPKNVMLGSYGEIYLIDWGMAVRLEEGVEKLASGGTAKYAPPERYLKKPVTPAYDVFSLGAILYQILTGYLPYDYIELEDAPELALDRAGREGEITPLLASVPRELREIAAKALAAKPEDRYQDAGEFADALLNYFNRADLLERFETAFKGYESTRAEFARATGARGKDARERRGALMNELTGRVAEFALIRAEAARVGASDDSRFAKAERSARQFQLRATLDDGDYNQASTLLVAFRDPGLALGDPVDFALRTAPFEREIAKGLASRQRARAMKFVVAIAALAVVGLAFFSLYLKAETERTKAEKKQAEADALITISVERVRSQLLKAEGERKLRHQTAAGLEAGYAPTIDYLTASKSNQTVAAIYGSLLKYSKDLPNVYSRLESTLANSMVIEKTTGFSTYNAVVAFSNDGAFFATRDSNTGLIFIWDANSLEAVWGEKVLLRNGGGEILLWFNPSFQKEDAVDPIHSSRFIATSTDGKFWFIDPKTARDGLRPSVFQGLEGASLACPPIFGAADKRGLCDVYMLTTTGEILVCSFPNGAFVRSFRLFDGSASPCNLAVSETGRYLVAGAKDGEVRRCNLNGSNVETLNLGLPKIEDLSNSFGYYCSPSPDGGKLLAISDRSGFAASGKFVVWDLEKNKKIAEVIEPKVDGAMTRFLSKCNWLDSKRFVTLCHNDHYRVWDLSKRAADGKPQCLEMKSDKSIKTSAFSGYDVSSDGSKLVVADNDGSLRAFDLLTGNQIARSYGICPFVHSFVASRFKSQNRLLSGSRFVKAVNEDNFDDVRIFEPYDSSLPNYFDGRYITDFACPDKGSVFTVAVSNVPPLGGASNPGARLDICFFDFSSSDNTPKKIVASAASSDTPKGGSLLKNGYSGVNCLWIATSPDGNLIAETRMGGSEIAIWDSSNLDKMSKPKTKFEKKNWTELQTATIKLFFLDPKQLVEVLIDGTTRLWDVETGDLLKERIVRRRSEDGRSRYDNPIITSTALSSKKDKLALGYQDGVLEVLDPRTFDVKFSGNYINSYVYSTNEFWTSSIREEGAQPLAFKYREGITGVSWDDSDNLVAISSCSGQTSVFRDFIGRDDPLDRHSPLEIVGRVLTPSFYDPLPTSSINDLLLCFFTKRNKLCVMDGLGQINQIDILARKGKYEVVEQAEEGGVFSSYQTLLCSQNTEMRAGVPIWGVNKNQLCIYKGDALIKKLPDVKDCQRWTYREKEVFVALSLRGTLSAIDPRTGEVVPTPLDGASGTPEDGFRFFATDEKGGKIAACDKSGKKVFLLDASRSDAEWNLILDLSKTNYKTTSTVFSRNSNKLFLSKIEETGALASQLLVCEIATGKSVSVKEIYSNAALIDSPNFDNVAYRSGRLLSVSDSYVVHTGYGSKCVVYDTNVEDVFQEIYLPYWKEMVDSVFTIDAADHLNKGAFEKKPAAFVIGTPDGVLHFYQLTKRSDDKFYFEPVYTLSQVDLNQIVQKTKTDLETDEFFDDSSDADLSDSLTELSKAEEELANHSNFDAPSVKVSPVRAISLTEDGRWLYVATDEELRRYDMAKIWSEIESASTRWTEEKVKKLTGIEFVEGKGTVPILSNRLVPTREKEKESSAR